MSKRVLGTPHALAGLPPVADVSWNQPCVSEPVPQQPRVPHSPDSLRQGHEADWIQAAQAGDAHAYGKLVDHYWDRLYRWLYHLTRNRHQAEDLTQETFLKALAHLKSFQQGSNFRAWLFRIGHNNFVNLKRAERRTKVALPDELPAKMLNDGPIDTLADREAVSAVSEAVNQLPPDFRSALLLHTQEGLSYREIAAILKTTEETARWRVFKARQKLLKVLAPELVPPNNTD
jgi:RNA polymerase sigma-70 factor, ECF subfamily